MSRQHITNMKNAVQGYFTKAVQAAAQAQKNTDMYRADVAEAENAKLRDALQAARLEAEAAIREAQDAGRADAERWGKLSGAEMTDDAKLLQMDLSADQFADLVDRYKENGTMTTLLAQYAERKNNEAAAADPIGLGRYDVSSIPTVEKRAEVYDKFATSARDLIARVDQNNTFGGGVNSPMLKASIEQFGEPNAFTAGLFELI